MMKDCSENFTIICFSKELMQKKRKYGWMEKNKIMTLSEKFIKFLPTSFQKAEISFFEILTI